MEQCLICDNFFKKSKAILARDNYYYLVCSYCSGGKLMPRKKALKGLKKAYQSEYFDWKEPVGPRKYLNKIQLFMPYPLWIQKKYSKAPGKLLDVGAGVPDFVIKMKNLGWMNYVLEIAPQQVRLFKKYFGNKNIFQGDFEIYKLKKNFFDILTFWHMLEHLVFPAKAIRKSASILNKNGMIFAEFPNFDSYNLKLFGQRYIHFDLPGHLVYYNKKSLHYLFEQNGFRIVEITYPLKLNASFSLNLSNLVFEKTKNSLLKMICFYTILPFSLVLTFIYSYMGKTDLMRVVAQKE